MSKMVMEAPKGTHCGGGVRKGFLSRWHPHWKLIMLARKHSEERRVRRKQGCRGNMTKGTMAWPMQGTYPIWEDLGCMRTLGPLGNGKPMVRVYTWSEK
jgi:hypothetical protein